MTSNEHTATTMFEGLFLLVAIVALAMWYALPAWLLYGWFVVPFGAPAVGYWHALGVILFLSSLRPGQPTGKMDSEQTAWVVLMPAVLICLGWFANSLMA